MDGKDEEGGMVKKGPYLKAGVIAHGTQVTREDVCAVKSPLLMVCVENDQLFPAEILESGRQYMEAHAVEHDIKIYPGVPHGKLSTAQNETDINWVRLCSGWRLSRPGHRKSTEQCL